MSTSIEKVQEVRFQADGLSLAGTVLTVEKPSPPGVIFLQGGSQDKARVTFREWQERLATAEIGSLAFDTRGTGDSEGEFTDSALANRLRDAEAAYDFYIRGGYVDPKRVGLVGNSMGGHVAARFAGSHPKSIKALVLKNAAAYSAESEDKKFKPSNEFSDAIRVSESWRGSPVFENIANYKGAVMLVSSEREDVLPPNLIDYWMEAVKNLDEHLVAPLATHAFMTKKDPVSMKAQDLMYQASIAFFKKNL